MRFRESDVYNLFAKDPTGFDLAISENNYSLVPASGGPIRLDEGEPTLKFIGLQNDSWFNLEPGESFIAVSADSYAIPARMRARAVTHQNAMICGLAVTASEPLMFDEKGHIKIVVQNISSARVVISVGNPIARIVFNYH